MAGTSTVCVIVGILSEKILPLKSKAEELPPTALGALLPVMGGFEATAKIREYEQAHALSRSPIIAFTAQAMLGDREKCIRRKADRPSSISDNTPAILVANRHITAGPLASIIPFSKYVFPWEGREAHMDPNTPLEATRNIS